MSRKTESISQSVAAKLISELKLRGYGATPANTSGKENSWDIEKIWVTSKGQDLCDINCENNTISYKNVYERAQVENILALIDNLQEQEENFLDAPNLKVEKLEKYKVLAQYNDVILAAWKVTGLDHTMHKAESIQYVTWEKDRSGPGYGVHTGHYYSENYEGAKEDFAKRSGLVNKDKLFSETEMIVLYAGLVKLEAVDESSNDNYNKTYSEIKNKVSNIIPDIEDKIYEKNPQYHENVKYDRMVPMHDTVRVETQVEEESDEREQEI